jgi:hypothetical protein
MPRTPAQGFSVESGHLVYHAEPARAGGKPYTRRCLLKVLEEVACAIEEAGAAGISNSGLVGKVGLPGSQVNVAVGLLKDRGLVTRIFGRRLVSASVDLYIDALIEYHALEAGAEPAADPAPEPPAAPPAEPPAEPA